MNTVISDYIFDKQIEIRAVAGNIYNMRVELADYLNILGISEKNGEYTLHLKNKLYPYGTVVTLNQTAFDLTIIYKKYC